jgi:hypothetical protein
MNKLIIEIIFFEECDSLNRDYVGAKTNEFFAELETLKWGFNVRTKWEK